MEKPEVLYHASQDTNVEEFQPRNDRPRYVGEEPLVFATPYRAVAAMFLASKHPMDVEINRFGDSFVLVVNGSREDFINQDNSGAIYALLPDNFTTQSEIGMGVTEWVSKVNVRPISKVVYDSSLRAMQDCGVQVYFVDNVIFKNIKTARDHGLKIIAELLH